jgi:hypothetical protein
MSDCIAAVGCLTSRGWRIAVDADQKARGRQLHTPVPCCSLVRMQKRLFAGELVGEFRGDWNAELFVLRRFHHQQNPEYERDEIDQFV